MNYTIDEFRKIIVSFLKEIPIQNEQINLIGHSLGGYIASEIAIQNQNLIRQLVLIDSSGMLERPTPILDEYFEAAMNPTQDNVRKAFEKMGCRPQKNPTAIS